MECSVCSAEFQPYNSQQKYCSVKCRNHNPAKTRATREFQQRRRDRINEIKMSAGCAVCGYKDHPAALDFNHVSGTKLFDISQDPKKAWKYIEAEIAKCEVLCANCHRVHTYEERHWHTKRSTRSGEI